MNAAANYYHAKHFMRIIRRNIRDENNPFDIPESRFRELYRFPQRIAMDFIEELTPFLIEATRSDAIPSSIKILSAMSFFASGSYQRRVGQDYLTYISQSSVSRFINEVAMAINNNLSEKYIRFPQTLTEQLIAKQKFRQLNRSVNFPGIIGCVDGGHIPLVALSKNIEKAHLNRKHQTSKNVQFICDASLRFEGVFARFSGATHDAYIWSISQARTFLESQFYMGERSTYLLGDSGYSLEPWLLTPFRINENSTELELHFNRCHAKIRNCIERAIGLLKARWRCCSKEKPLRYSPEKAGNIINACAVLHNILIQNNVSITEQENIMIELEVLEHRRDTPALSRTTERITNASISRAAGSIRQSVARNLSSERYFP